MDVKEAGNSVYIIGETKDELGGSHYYMIHGFKGNDVPSVNLKKVKKSFNALIKAMDKGLVRACHDCSEGGIGVAAAEMAFAGELGMKIDLKKVPSKLKRNDKILFSESNSRFLVEVRKKDEKKFEKIMKGNVYEKIGDITPDKKLTVISLNGKTVVDADVIELKKVWKSTFDW